MAPDEPYPRPPHHTHLSRGGGRLQQPLLLPQAARHDARDLHGLLQVLALEVLLDAAKVVLVQDVVLLQEAAVLLVDLAQQVVEHQGGVGLLVGGVGPGDHNTTDVVRV